MSRSDDRIGYVDIWGKGFRVTEDSEEFQRLVPLRRSEPLTELESHWDNFSSWARVLESLYRAGEIDVAAQKCLLVRSTELTSVAFSTTKDRHRRLSLVMVAVRAPISWDQDSLGDIAARSCALAVRLADAYAKSFEHEQGKIQSQLRDGTFLSNRRFELTAENTSGHEQWISIIRAVKEWNGVIGIATPKLVDLGANVVIGTKHEAEMAAKSVDGYFDIRDQGIHPLSPRLTKWRPVTASTDIIRQIDPPPDNAATSPMASSVELPATIQSIDDSLREINKSTKRMADSFELLVDILDRAYQFMLPEKMKRPRK